MLAELIVAATILGMILVGLAVSLDGFARFNHYELVRQRCIAAGIAQLDSVTATGRPISEEAFGKRWPKLEFSVDQMPGEGQWEGNKLVTVTVSGPSTNHKARVTLSRYVFSGSDSAVAANDGTPRKGGL
jgi:hypothetical protein